jgi:hypothetical protein
MMGRWQDGKLSLSRLRGREGREGDKIKIERRRERE